MRAVHMVLRVKFPQEIGLACGVIQTSYSVLND